MKAVLFVLLLLLPVSHAALNDWTVEVQLNDDKTTLWNVTLLYNETVAKSDYFIFGTITDYEALGDGVPLDCRLVKELGSSIICQGISAKKINYVIKTGPLSVDVLQNFRLFTYKFAATVHTDRYSLVIKLPLGSALVEPARLAGVGLRPFEPESGVQGSDGRRILIEWTLDKPQLGETLNVAIVYELVGGLQLGIFAGIIAALVLGFLAFLFFFFRRQPIKDMLPILTEGERKVMEILLREKGTVDQRVIVKETDFSKAKVSRVIHDLVQRGIIEKISKGRKNLIMLKKTQTSALTAFIGSKAQKTAKAGNAENKD